MPAFFQRAVVTGGAGFLGSHLCAELLRRGTDVVCVDNLLTGRRQNLSEFAGHPGFRFIECDVLEMPELGGSVDLVAHLASPASPPDYLRWPIETLRVGSEGTMRMVELARSKRARFLLASTSEVYGDPQEHPQRETYWGHVNPVGPRSVYDESKRYAEALTAAYRRNGSADTAIARIFNSYGPRMRVDDGRMVPTFIDQCLRGEPMTVTGDGSQTRSICYVDDTIRGLLALAESDLPGPVNIGNSVELTVCELALKIRKLTGADSPLHYIDMPADDPRRRCPDVTRAAQELGWWPAVDPDTGLRHTVDWFASARLAESHFSG